MLWGIGVSAVGIASVWEQWLLHGSRFWEEGGLSISAVHSDSLGVVINFIYLLVCLVFRAYLSLAILIASFYEIVVCVDRIGLLY